MDKPLIQITNYRVHPTDKRYIVFMYHDLDAGDYFESLLKRHQIKYEADFDEENDPPRKLYAVPRTHFESAVELNYEAFGRHRKPLLGDSPFKWVLFVFVAIVLTLAVIAYVNR